MYEFNSIELSDEDLQRVLEAKDSDDDMWEELEDKCPVIVDEVTWNSVHLARKRKSNRKDQQNATIKNF